MLRQVLFAAVVLLVACSFAFPIAASNSPVSLASPRAALQPGEQSYTRTFPETGRTVSGKFLQYWDTHGGLAQQGYPITSEMQEESPTDGKTYTMQYFERAVFELHPENPPPYDVLLSLLGVYTYNRKYPAGSPGRLPGPGSEPGAHLFAETGHTLGGLFLQYWTAHGGLLQQGFPISEEFEEVSELNGRTYRVQYFERAVLEMHRENPPPYNVLLSQLGTLYLRDKNRPTATATAAPTATPTVVPRPTATMPPCDTTNTVNGSATPTSGRPGDTIVFLATGFRPGEPVVAYIAQPTGEVPGDLPPYHANPDGSVGPLSLPIYSEFARHPGRWSFAFEGEVSHNLAVIYFCIYP